MIPVDAALQPLRDLYVAARISYMVKEMDIVSKEIPGLQYVLELTAMRHDLMRLETSPLC